MAVIWMLSQQEILKEYGDGTSVQSKRSSRYYLEKELPILFFRIENLCSLFVIG
jgi:hypothetical protein